MTAFNLHDEGFFQIAMERLDLSGRFYFVPNRFAELVRPIVVALI